jgi:hypothetical protein
MALVTRAADASPDASTAQFAPQIPDLIAGEAIDPVAPCRIDASDGMVYMSNGTAADANARVDGFSARKAAAGQPVTLLGHGTRFRYAASGLTPGARLYVGATAGRLDDGATTGDAVGVAKVINATDIRVVRDN